MKAQIAVSTIINLIAGGLPEGEGEVLLDVVRQLLDRIDELERDLKDATVQLGGVYSVTLSPEWMSSNKINAIRLHRAGTQYGLKASKDLVEVRIANHDKLAFTMTPSALLSVFTVVCAPGIVIAPVVQPEVAP